MSREARSPAGSVPMTSVKTPTKAPSQCGIHLNKKIISTPSGEKFR